ncbi:MAG TPA: response regulator [Pseudomonadota bacterium]|nr:response regulator [Pseudomonadota bacterium]
MSTVKQQLLQRFRSSAIERLRRIDLELRDHSAPRSEEAHRTLRRDLHTIKGEARMLGLRGLSTVIHRIEDLIADGPDGKTPPTAEQVGQVQAALPQVISALSDAVQEGSTLSIQLGVVESTLGLPTPQAGTEASPSSANSIPLPAAQAVVPDAEPTAVNPTDAATTAEARPAAAADSEKESERWVHVSAQRIDTLCDGTAELEVGFRALYSQLQATRNEPVLSQNALRALYEQVEQFRTQFDEVVSQVWALRLAPVEHLLVQLAEHGYELAATQGKRVQIRLSSGSAQLERSVIDSLWDPLVHIIRNAIDHGIEEPDERGEKPAEGQLSLSAESQGPSVVLTVRDDGRGIDPERVRLAAVQKGLLSESAATALSEEQIHRLLFRQGFSTKRAVSDVSGRGVGLDVVLSAIERVGGTVSLTSQKGQGTTIQLTVPSRLSHERALVFGYGQALFAIPSRQILDVLRLSEQTIRTVAGGKALWSRQGVMPLISMATALGIGDPAQVSEETLAVVISLSDDRSAFAIAGVIGEFDLLRKPGDQLFFHCSGCLASATLDDGRLVLYLNPAALLARARQKDGALARIHPSRQKKILVVEDSPIVRQLTSLALGSGGYAITTAEDGRQGLSACERELPDLVVSDLDMPEMDGLTLLSHIRERWPGLPVIIFSNHASPEYQQRARALGASEYVVKSKADRGSLLLAVQRLLGPARDS